MVIGMATSKLTITLDDKQLREIKELVAGGESLSVSGFVKRAVHVALQDAAGWDEMLRQSLDETGGPMTKKERAWADSILLRKSTRRGGSKGGAA
jgi:Arc/MetJ-type ribon-helix-helix transcriptional regulator